LVHFWYEIKHEVTGRLQRVHERIKQFDEYLSKQVRVFIIIIIIFFYIPEGFKKLKKVK